jgi:hypothetical protein
MQEVNGGVAMTEGEWLECTDLYPMRKLLEGSGRKWRLFAVACCRLVWPHIQDERSRMALEISERFADGLASIRELRTANCLAKVPFEEQEVGPLGTHIYISGPLGAVAYTTYSNRVTINAATTVANMASLGDENDLQQANIYSVRLILAG